MPWPPGIYPKRVRIVLLAVDQDRTGFMTAAEYRVRRQELLGQGWRPAAWVTVPLRRLSPREGAWRCYTYWANHYTNTGEHHEPDAEHHP
jgi:hypothetical protein